MGRRRTHDRHLPQGVYHKHGAYYRVHQNKWTRLGSTLPEALHAYAESFSGHDGSMSALLDEVLVQAQAKRLARNTLIQYTAMVSQLKDVMTEFNVTDVRPKDIAALMDHWVAHPNKANRARSVLKLAFDIAVRRGEIDSNPVASIGRHKERKRDRYISDAEFQAILANASPIGWCIFSLGYFTAQRIGDVLAIDNAHLTNDGIEFDQQKTKKKLVVVWNDALCAVVDRAKAIRPADATLLLPLPNGKRRSYKGVSDLWNRTLVKAGVTDAHIHDIRAKSLTDAKRQGLDATALAGHTTQAQTVRYLRGKERDVVVGPGILDR